MIYLDHAAATPVDERVLTAMMPYFRDDFFNPSSAYLPAKKVALDYENAKATIAHAIGAKTSDIIMTAGATEANNLAFTAVRDSAAFSKQTISSSKSYETSSRVLYLETEHDSVRKVAEAYGGTVIRVLESGVIDLEDLKGKISDETELISVALVNNELGTIQPLSEVAEIIRNIRLERLKKGLKRQLLLHSDASQALNLLDVNVARIGVDLMTLNAAKVYGPKGVGALYVSHEARLKPLTFGGGQENGLRSGTENVSGVIGFSKAIEIAKEHVNGNRKKYKNLKAIFLSELKDYELINKRYSLDNFIVLCYNYIDAERLIFLLEEQGVYVSTGAACAASKGEKSHVLKAIGLSNAQIAGSLRITLGETNDEAQIHEVARIINDTVKAERERVKNER